MLKGTKHKRSSKRKMSERIREALSALKNEGTQLGRPEVDVDRAAILKLQQICVHCGKPKAVHIHEDHKFKAHSLRAIAAKLGCSVNTVQVRLGKLDYSPYRSKD